MGDASHSNTGAIIVPARKIQLTDMPVEIFERIFEYTGYKEVSNMRLVNFVFFFLFLLFIQSKVRFSKIINKFYFDRLSLYRFQLKQIKFVKQS